MRVLFTLTALTSCLILAACDNASGPGSSNPALQGQDAGSGMFLSADGSVKIQCPSGWVVTDLNDAADIEVANVADDTYMLVMSEYRADYAGDITQHSNDTRSGLVSSLTNVKQDGPSELEVNGNPAIQYKITGAFDRTNIIYLHTTIQTEEKLHQVLTWSAASQFNKHEPIFQKMIRSVEEVEPTTP